MGVLNKIGATELILMPLVPISPAALLFKPMTACFVAEYAEVF